jgi:hypothetical protein
MADPVYVLIEITGGFLKFDVMEESANAKDMGPEWNKPTKPLDHVQ